MDDDGRSNVVPFAGAGGSRLSFERTPKPGRFCAWRGASDRRYVATVHPIDLSGADLGLPAFQACVLFSVVRSGTGRRVVDVALAECAAERRSALAAGLARRADEWHVHLLPDDSRLRVSMVADLRARHGSIEEARCA